MIIELDDNFLTKNEITAKEYLLCFLLVNGNINRIKKYDKIDQFDTEFLINLEKKGLIKKKEIPAIMFLTINNIEVTNKFKGLIDNVVDPFEEFWSIYPLKVIRLNGEISTLKINRGRTKQKYEKIIRGKPLLHKTIMNCLRYELAYRIQNDSIKWMKNINNWLEGEEWKNFEEMIDKNLAAKTDKPSYGTNLL